METRAKLFILARYFAVFLALCGPRRAQAAEPEDFSDSHASFIHVPLLLAHEGHEMAGGEASESGWQHFVSWIGHFHPAMTVFPIAMILSAALAELLRVWTKSPWLGGASRWSMIVGGVGAANPHRPLARRLKGHGPTFSCRWLNHRAVAGAFDDAKNVRVILCQRSCGI